MCSKLKYTECVCNKTSICFHTPHIHLCLCTHGLPLHRLHISVISALDRNRHYIFYLTCNCSSCGWGFFWSFIWPMYRYLKYNLYVHIYLSILIVCVYAWQRIKIKNLSAVWTFPLPTTSNNVKSSSEIWIRFVSKIGRGGGVIKLPTSIKTVPCRKRIVNQKTPPT